MFLVVRLNGFGLQIVVHIVFIYLFVFNLINSHPGYLPVSWTCCFFPNCWILSSPQFSGNSNVDSMVGKAFCCGVSE